MSALWSGSRFLVQYLGAALWHERIVIARIGPGQFLVLTPDGDVYVEDYREENRDVTAVRVLKARSHMASLPEDIAAADVYRFRAPVAGSRIKQILSEAVRVARVRGNDALAELVPNSGAGSSREPPPVEGPDGAAGR